MVSVPRFASSVRGVGCAAAPAWVGRGLLVTALFVLMSICHGAMLPGQAAAASLQEHVPVHALDCATDVKAAAPSSIVAKFLPAVQLMGDAAALASVVEPPVEPASLASTEPPAVRRARLQVFLI